MWFNPFIKILLKSPLHPILSNDTMLMTYKGVKSGKSYSIPVNYARRDERLYTISFRRRTWWRNFLAERPVELLIAGEKFQASAQAYTHPPDVARMLEEVVMIHPVYARYLLIQLDADGKPDPADILQAADGRVVIRYRLEQT